MKKMSMLIALVVTMLFVSGCSSKKKNVAFDEGRANESYDTMPAENVKQNTVIQTPKQVVSAIEDKLSYVNVVTSNINGQDISLRSIHFAFDRYNLSDEMRVIEKDNYSIINPVVSSDASVKIKLEGNTDEFGSDEYNVALGLKRARAVKNTLIGYGIPANKISLVSLGEGNPICGAKTESCYKKNRRVDHKLLK